MLVGCLVDLFWLVWLMGWWFVGVWFVVATCCDCGLVLFWLFVCFLVVYSLCAPLVLICLLLGFLFDVLLFLRLIWFALCLPVCEALGFD